MAFLLVLLALSGEGMSSRPRLASITGRDSTPVSVDELWERVTSSESQSLLDRSLWEKPSEEDSDDSDNETFDMFSDDPEFIDDSDDEISDMFSDMFSDDQKIFSRGRFKGKKAGGGVCCQSMDLKCVACNAGKKPVEYCDENPTTKGCGEFCKPAFCDGESAAHAKCCEAKCLAENVGWSVAEYCSKVPYASGCVTAFGGNKNTLIDDTFNIGNPDNGCCSTKDLTCIAQKVKMTETEYCHTVPKTYGCRSWCDAAKPAYCNDLVQIR